jgi:hypothetical protein
MLLHFEVTLPTSGSCAQGKKFLALVMGCLDH